MRDFKNLKVWQHAHQLALEIYKATAAFPSQELYGLTSQIRRAATSIPSNIAEGSGKGGDQEFARYLQIARGSASELEYQLLLASDLGYLDTQIYERLASELNHIQRMLGAFLKRLRSAEP